jgi:hypothetical protein
MRGLKTTRHPGLFKLKGIYWGRIKVGRRDRHKSFQTQSESAALASPGIWRNELELEKGQAAGQKRNSADLSPDTADNVEERVHASREVMEIRPT